MFETADGTIDGSLLLNQPEREHHPEEEVGAVLSDDPQGCPWERAQDQQDHKQYPGDADHSLAQSGDPEITFKTIKKTTVIPKGNKLPCGTVLQPTGEHELGDVIEEIVWAAVVSI